MNAALNSTESGPRRRGETARAHLTSGPRRQAGQTRCGLSCEECRAVFGGATSGPRRCGLTPGNPLLRRRSYDGGGGLHPAQIWQGSVDAVVIRRVRRIRAAAGCSACVAGFDLSHTGWPQLRQGPDVAPPSARRSYIRRSARFGQRAGSVRKANRRRCGGGGPDSPELSNQDGIQPIPASCADQASRSRQRQASAGDSLFRA